MFSLSSIMKPLVRFPGSEILCGDTSGNNSTESIRKQNWTMNMGKGLVERCESDWDDEEIKVVESIE